MPAPKSDVCSGKGYLNKVDFTQGDRPSSPIYWSESLYPFAFRDDQHSKYVQLAKAIHVDKLAKYVDEKLQELETRLDKQEADAKAREEACQMEPYVTLASKDEVQAVERELAKSASALDAMSQSMRQQVTRVSDDLQTATNVLKAAHADLKEEIFKKLAAKDEAEAEDKARAQDVALHGLSAKAKVAKENLDASAAFEEKAQDALQTLEKLIAAGTPVDAAPATKVHEEAKKETARCQMAFEGEEAMDAAALAKSPEQMGAKFKALELELMKAISKFIIVTKEPLEAKLDELTTAVSDLSEALTKP